MVKYTLEFPVKSSTQVLYNYIASASGLSEWFADDANLKDGIFTFNWDGDEEEAELVNRKNGEYIKLKWVESEEMDTYFEMRIVIDPLTKDIALVVTDFAESAELEEAKQLWESQIEQLFMVIGA